MLYLPILVAAIMVVVVSGWRNAVKIAASTTLICLWLGLAVSVNMRAVPQNLWAAFRGLVGLPVYLVLHPGEWLFIFLPLAAFIVLFVAVSGWRHLYKRAH